MRVHLRFAHVSEEADGLSVAILIGDGDDVLANSTGFVLKLLNILVFLFGVNGLSFILVWPLNGDLRDLIGDAKGGFLTNFVIEVEEKSWLAIVDEVSHKRNEVIKEREI